MLPLIWIFDNVFEIAIFESFNNLTKSDDVVTRRFVKLSILFLRIIQRSRIELCMLMSR